MATLGFGQSEYQDSKIEKAPGVSIATDWQELQNQHAPPQVEIKTQTLARTKWSSGSPCHGGPACLLIGALWAYDHFFPQRYIAVSKFENQKLVYEAEFSLSHDFISATTFEGSLQKDFLKVHLPALGKIYVFQISEGEKDSENFKLLSLNKQADLLAQYQEKLKTLSEPYKRRKVYREILAWVGLEAKDFILKALEDSKEPQKTKRQIVYEVCRSNDYFPLEWLDHVKPSENDLASAAVLLCFVDKKEPRERWAPYVRPAVLHMCQNEVDNHALSLSGTVMHIVLAPSGRRSRDANAKHVKGYLGGFHTLIEFDNQKIFTEYVLTHLPSCREGPIKTLASYVYGKPTSLEKMSDVLAHEDFGLAEYATDKMHEDDDFTKDAILKALARIVDQKLDKKHKTLVEKLTYYPKTNWARDEDLELLSRIYVKFLPKSLFWKLYFEYTLQNLMLKLFRRNENVALKSKAVSYLKKEYQNASDQNKPLIAMVFVLLGDNSWIGKAAEGLMFFEDYYDDKKSWLDSFRNHLDKTVGEIQKNLDAQVPKRPLAKTLFYKRLQPKHLYEIIINGFHVKGCDEFEIEKTFKTYLKNKKKWKNENFCSEPNRAQP